MKRLYNIVVVLIGIGTAYLMTYTLFFFRYVRGWAKRMHQ